MLTIVLFIAGAYLLFGLILTLKDITGEYGHQSLTPWVKQKMPWWKNCLKAVQFAVIYTADLIAHIVICTVLWPLPILFKRASSGR
jgi:hypothetical protein